MKLHVPTHAVADAFTPALNRIIDEVAEKLADEAAAKFRVELKRRLIELAADTMNQRMTMSRDMENNLIIHIDMSEKKEGKTK